MRHVCFASPVSRNMSSHHNHTHHGHFAFRHRFPVSSVERRLPASCCHQHCHRLHPVPHSTNRVNAICLVFERYTDNDNDNLGNIFPRLVPCIIDADVTPHSQTDSTSHCANVRQRSDQHWLNPPRDHNEFMIQIILRSVVPEADIRGRDK